MAATYLRGLPTRLPKAEAIRRRDAPERVESPVEIGRSCDVSGWTISRLYRCRAVDENQTTPHLRHQGYCIVWTGRTWSASSAKTLTMLRESIPTNDYPIPQRWKHRIFRRGYLPMGDLHDILARVEARREAREMSFQRHLSNVHDVQSLQFRKALALIEKDRNNEFIRLFSDEAKQQWDRIIDRRFSGVLFNTVFLVVCFLLGKL